MFTVIIFSFKIQAQEKKTVYFGIDQDKLDEKTRIDLIKWFEEKDKKILILQGFCDSTSHIQYNRNLAQRRVENIKNTLLEVLYFDVNEIKTEIYGEEFDLHPHDSLNRKVVIVYENHLLEPKSPIEKAEFLEKSEEIMIHQTTLNDFEKQLTESVVGTKISLYDMNFEFNSSKLVNTSDEYLNLLVNFLKLNPETHIKILGHMCCNKNATTKLSEQRAKYIYHYLIEKNIAKKRLSYEGKGVSEPIFKIPEANLQQQKTNRRVEIEILKK
jgi:outer membrane protein OmpA-like peptidoglycan-associated protein